jgi:hypothetical protein
MFVAETKNQKILSIFKFWRGWHFGTEDKVRNIGEICLKRTLIFDRALSVNFLSNKLEG